MSGMDTLLKLEILSDAAKYDAACTSSGSARGARRGALGDALPAGCCHSFTADGRCVSLLKVLFTNCCAYDCAYCVNRKSNDVPRASFSPRELADLTIAFYRRNYIEGLFLSSGVACNPDYTMELLIETVRILREEERFNGYIHVKAIPGASPELVHWLGCLVDRISVNIELPSQGSLGLLAPQKRKAGIVKPMGLIRDGIEQAAQDKRLAKRSYLRKEAPSFAPAGQSTQMIVGATPESDRHILELTGRLYSQFKLKRVFFSAYAPVNEDSRLPSLETEVPLTREHRLYQADWLLRFYGFSASELVAPGCDNLELGLDPKAAWALRNIDRFPIEVNKATYEELLRVPGIGVKAAKRIIRARRRSRVGYDDLGALRVSLNRAGWFITCNGKMDDGYSFDVAKARLSLENAVLKSGAGRKLKRNQVRGQLALFEPGVQSAYDSFAASGHKDILLEKARSTSLEPIAIKTTKQLDKVSALLREARHAQIG